MEKKKSKTNLLQKFAEKFKKKKRAKSTSASREKSSELTQKGRRKSHSPNKPKAPPQNGPPSIESKSTMDLMEVTAKGLKKEKKEEKRSSDKKKEKKENSTPSTSPSTLALRRADSQMEVSGNAKNIEKSVKLWMESLEKPDFKKTMESVHTAMDNMKVDMEKCQAFKKNMELCQSENVELLDANRVKGPNGEANFFFHGSILSMPGVTNRTTILSQLPIQEDQSSIESFWLMIAANKIQRLYCVIGEDELDKKTMSDYFPDDFMEFKTCRVNNRKTVFKSDDQLNTQLFYEVVPKDCAEAPFCMIEICDFWPDGKIPTQGYGRIAGTAASVFDSDIDVDASCAVTSNYGAGRAGSFIVGAIAIEKIRNGEAPNIKEIGNMVRSQRPGSIETLSQYVFTHIMALHYTLKYVKDKELKGRIEKMISQLEQFGCEKMMEEEEEDSAASNTVE